MASAVYDNVNTILNAARARLQSDLPTLYPISGHVLDRTQAATQQGVNNAWRKLQERLADLGFLAMTNEIVMAAIPIVQSTDPATQIALNWDGFFDGANQLTDPFLPDYVVQPLKIWERQNGMNSSFPREPMEMILDGLPACQKTSFNRFWEWRNNTIYMPGSLMLMDLRIKYIQFFPDFVDTITDYALRVAVPWFQQQVFLVRCLEPFSLLICAEFAPDAPTAELYTTAAEGAMKKRMNLEIKARQRVNVRRQGRSGDGSGMGWY